MKFLSRIFGLLTVISCVGIAWPSEPHEFLSLFDGKTFSGWEGNLAVFRVQDGAIVGGTLSADIPHNDFLASEKEYSDFELRAKVKLIGAETNGGIQIRSQRVPNHFEMAGYQADSGQAYWGALYDESRRNRILSSPAADTIGKIVHRDDWNEYRIRCQGRRIEIWLNGVQTVDYTEPDESLVQKGRIGLQIHRGPPAEAWYKDIEILELGN